MNYGKKWTIDELQSDLLQDDKEIRNKFIEYYTSGIATFIRSFVNATDLLSKLPIDETKQHHRVSSVYILNSLNCLYISMKLLINGYSLASGNIMRQFGESIATSLLCSTAKLRFAKDIETSPNTFAYQKTVKMLQKKEIRKELNLNKIGITVFEQIQKAFDDYSHASYVSLGWSFKFVDKQKHFFGPIFDEDIRELYRKEIVMRRSGCVLARDVIIILTRMRKNEE